MKFRYHPMLARSAVGPFSSSEWLFEVKWDGIRAIAYINEQVSIQSRNSQELAGRFPELDELRTLAPHTVLDGEIVVMRGGRPEIQPLLSRLQAGTPPASPGMGTVPVTYIVFDILEKDGNPLISLPFFQRRKILKQRVAEGPHIILSVPVEERGREYYQTAIAAGLEGIMAKRKDGLYLPGQRSDAWLKIKAKKTCDCLIAGYTTGQESRSSSFGALLLGLYENGRNETPTVRGKHLPPDAKSPASHTTGSGRVYIGKVGSGFSDDELAVLMHTFESLKTTIPQLPDVGKTKGIVWLKPVLVCEVAYKEVTRDNKLRIPTFLRIRSDKKPRDCTTDQLTTMKINTGQQEMRVMNEPGSEGSRSSTGEMSMEQETPKGTPRTPRSKKGSALKEYREMRNVAVTGEPEGTIPMKGLGNSFVVQEHHSHHLHYDLRLERDGVLKSWAVPKGIPTEPGEKHLAVAVEDHPLDYKDFEGTIPEGEYGAGIVSIWDQGTYETTHWDSDKIEVVLHGNHLSGHYVLVTFKRAGEHEWLLFKARK